MDIIYVNYYTCDLFRMTMEEQRWVSTDFLQLYQQDKDNAYRTILDHAAALLSQTHNNLILKADGAPMDFNLLIQHISTALHTGHVQQQNILPLPIPIQDTNPIDLQRMEDEKH